MLQRERFVGTFLTDAKTGFLKPFNLELRTNSVQLKWVKEKYFVSK